MALLTWYDCPAETSEALATAQAQEGAFVSSANRDRQAEV